MIRRRRRPREIPFSFDSFLDVVANVVGIIIRLILVVWVGARSYTTLMATPRPAVIATKVPSAAELTDTLKDEIAQQRDKLAQAQAKLLEQLQQLEEVRRTKDETVQELAVVSTRVQGLEHDEGTIDEAAAAKEQQANRADLTLAELREREQRLTASLEALQKLPPLRKILRYRTPVSRPVHAEELTFECRAGRVTFVDLAALLAEVRRGLEDKATLLRTQWQIPDVAGPVGPFRLRYVVERERDLLDSMASTGLPPANGNFRYGLSEWAIEPMAGPRGETAEVALAKGSEFRQVVDVLDAQQSVVTFWVYPDSFALYRQLRDYLHERDVEVAGRPLPEGMMITFSRRGTVSRGQ